MPARTSRLRSVPDIWPGFVDAMAALLVIIIFMLMVFTLGHFFLTEQLSGRDETIDGLNRQISELAEMLLLERDTSTELRKTLSLRSSELQSLIAERDRLSESRDGLAEQLAAMRIERTAMAEQRDKAVSARDEALKLVEADKEKIETQLKTLESLRRDIMALKSARIKLEAEVTKMVATIAKRDEALTASRDKAGELESKVTEAAATIKERDKALTTLRDRTKELEARLSTEEERTALAQKEIKQRDVWLKELVTRTEDTENDLDRERKLSASAKARVELLSNQIAALRKELAMLNAALEASEAEALVQKIEIVNLGKRLNAALASKIHELARYRSDFFGKLRKVLGQRKGIRIVGDRFVFQSEVLFSSGSANLAPGGKKEIGQLAATLKEISARIPGSIDWVLRVDGHTDRIPIQTPAFPSNWELSTGRAIAVVKRLIELGLPPNRLAATGFGEHRPLDPGDDEIAYRRNRRIEFKLTGR